MDKLEPSACQETLQNAPFGVVVLDPQNRIQSMNRTMAEFLGIDAAQALGKFQKDCYKGIMESFDANAHIWHIPASAHAQERWLLQVSSPVQGKSLAHYYSDATEIVKLRTETHNLRDQLERAATNDPVTGVLNRRALLAALEPQVSRSRRYGNPLAMILMQVDNFKSLNNAVTPVTEHVLKGISFFLRDQLRWVDLVGRTNDKEFTLVLPETSLDDAQKLANKILERMDGISLPDMPEVSVAVSIRIGVTQWDKGDDSSKLLRKTEEAMKNPLAASA